MAKNSRAQSITAYSDDDKEYVVSHWHKKTTAEIATDLHRGNGAIRQLAYRLLGTTKNKADG